MHYYQFNIGDYAKATRHLSNTEDLAYRRLIDLYYDKELPLVKDVEKLSRLINMRDSQQEIATVLEDFFEETEDGYKQSRIESEIANYRAKADAARVNGKKGGRPKKPKQNPEETESEPKKTQLVNLANPEETESKANHKPITNNQEPLTKEQDKDPLSAKANNQAFEIFKYWCEVMKKSPATSKLTPKREKAIKARIKDGYTIAQIKQAVDGCRLDAFSMGNNDRQKPFNDIELICRTGEKLESFMENTGNEAGYQRKTTGRPSAADRQRARIAAEYGYSSGQLGMAEGDGDLWGAMEQGERGSPAVDLVYSSEQVITIEGEICRESDD